MRRESYRERAIVVRTYDFGEADRIIVLLTRGRGLVRGVAKGVRRTKSRFGSRLQPFVELDVQLYAGRNLESITQAETVSFLASGIIEDLERYAAASAVLEAVEKLSVASFDEAEELYDLTIAALESIRTAPDPIAALDTYFLQAMNLCGWAPSLFACAQCGQVGPHHAFHPAPGGAVCVNCRPQGAAEVDEEVLHLMWLWQNDYEGEARELETPARVATAHQLTRAYIQWHMEKKLSSLNVLDQARRG